MSRSGIAEIDSSDASGARAVERLSSDRIGWLTTVAPDGTPQVSPIWFLWDSDEILVYSLDSPRARNIASHPRVSLNLDGNGLGGDIVIVEGNPAENISDSRNIKHVFFKGSQVDRDALKLN